MNEYNTTMEKKCEELELRIKRLEDCVHQLIQQISHPPQHGQVVELRERPIQTIDQWCNAIQIGETEFKRLVDNSYYDCLKKTLYENIKNNSPFYGNQRKLYIYMDNQWTLANVQIIKDIIEKISLKYQEYYFKRDRPTRETHTQKEIDLEFIYVCKINENKFREEAKLKELLKYIISILPSTSS